MRFKDWTVMVTGGGRGIGRAVALAFGREGANVMLASRSKDRLEATAAELRALGTKPMVAVLTVTDETAVAAAVREAHQSTGRLDVLVNNAGVGGPTTPGHEMNAADWRETLEVNLTGAFLCAKHAIPHLVASEHGRIINITSIAGQIGYALRSPYAASKWGMIGLTRSLALEVGPKGVTVNAIAPGSTRGERLANVVRDRAAVLGKTPEEVEREFFVSASALGRLVEPEEIAAAAVFLASDDARNITGDTLTVSAGFRL